MDLQALCGDLNRQSGPRYWRSLEELASTPEFEELVKTEFPSLLPLETNPTSRRRFLQLMGASLALAGLNACGRQPLEKIVPYVKQPEDIVPGRPLYFATSMAGAGGASTGLLVESHLGRPTKLEGNPEHPSSLGATDLFAQASVLGLYDPDRTQAPVNLGEIRSWAAFEAELGDALVAQQALGGRGLRVLSSTVVSPTLANLRQRLIGRFPECRWHQYEAASGNGARVGARRAFGASRSVHYDLAGAAVVVAIDSDFLATGPGCVRYARDFMATRRAREGAAEMSRLYAIESAASSTGTVADHRLALAPRELEGFVLALAFELGVPGMRMPAAFATGENAAWVQAIADDLRAHRGAGAVIVGEECDPSLHVLALAIDERLGNLGGTVLPIDSIEADPVDQFASLAQLVADMNAGEVDLLVVLDGNPVFDAPGDLGFVEAFTKAGLRAHLGPYANETAEYCHWHLPAKHYLESWGDGRAHDGTISMVQPLLEPLYDGRSDLQLVALLAGESSTDDLELVQAHWRGERGEDGFDDWWRSSLHDGLIEGSGLPFRDDRVAPSAIEAAASELTRSHEAGRSLSVVFRPDPTVLDGRFANNGWLQECPKPLSRLTWDNAALMAPTTAAAKGLEAGDMIELGVDGRTVELPVWILPGQAPDTILLHLGYGRRRGGHVAAGCGYDVSPLRSSSSPQGLRDVRLRATGASARLATTQSHHSMEGRDLVRVGTLEQLQHDPGSIGPHGHGIDPDLSMYPGWDYSEGHAWGLSVDLSACMGCNACVVACQSENNIPVVGKDEVLNGREMHWIRVDRYFEGEAEGAGAHNQPVMCMHCEQAPCETVCPVSATVHSDEGLNDMVYNRCVGTRYCSNNCPYKVRRFNFYEYQDRESQTLAMQRNPDVTVRMRGVMEKCTYCVQRINGARIEAKTAGRSIADGEITTACQQVCPSQAIVFGDINDPESAVAKEKHQPLSYGLLTDLGTRPRTTYLAKLRNPHPSLIELDSAYREDPHQPGAHGEAGHDGPDDTDQGAKEASHG